MQQNSKRDAVSVLFIVAKKNHEILTALHYKPQKNGVKSMQAAGYGTQIRF